MSDDASATQEPAPARASEAPSASRETLLRLLALETESPELDFKTELHPDDKRGLLSLTRHIAAMAATGGHLVVGADDRGRPTGRVTLQDFELFDENRLRGNLGKFLPCTS